MTNTNNKDDCGDAPSGLAEVPQANVDARSGDDAPKDASRVENNTSTSPNVGSDSPKAISKTAN